MKCCHVKTHGMSCCCACVYSRRRACHLLSASSWRRCPGNAGRRTLRTLKSLTSRNTKKKAVIDFTRTWLVGYYWCINLHLWISQRPTQLLPEVERYWICHRSLVGPPLSSACRFKGGTWQQPQYWFKQRRIVCHGKRGKCNPCHYSWRISATCREEKLVANKYQKHLRVAGKISTGGVLNIGFVDVSCYKQGIPTAPNEGHPVFLMPKS